MDNVWIYLIILGAVVLILVGLCFCVVCCCCCGGKKKKAKYQKLEPVVSTDAEAPEEPSSKHPHSDARRAEMRRKWGDQISA